MQIPAPDCAQNVADVESAGVVKELPLPTIFPPIAESYHLTVSCETAESVRVPGPHFSADLKFRNQTTSKLHF